jgi:hypothetical protein
MKDLRKLIRKVLREETNQSDVDLDIRYYEGDDKEINRMKESIYFGYNLSKKDIKYAHEFFNKKDEINRIPVKKDEIDRIFVENMIKNYYGDSSFLKNLWVKLHMGNPLTNNEIALAKLEFESLGIIKDGKIQIKSILPDIKKFNSPLKSQIKKKGIESYLDLLKSNKKYILESLFVGSNFKVGKPSDYWFETNISDLTFLRDSFNSTKDKIRFHDGISSTFKVRINEMIDKCENKDFYGILETEGEIDMWSLLNKIDTNYMNWGEMIKDRQELGDLKEGGDPSIINDYFKQRNISDVLSGSDLMNTIKDVETKNGIEIKSLSYADVDVFEAFKDISGPKLEKIFERIGKTTKDGEEVEKRFTTWLSTLDPKYVKQEDIRKFSLWGSIVDMTFGIDLVVNFFGTLYAIQVKKNEDNAQKSFIQSLGIPYFVIYPKSSTKSSTKKEIYQFNFLSEKERGYFNEWYEENVKKRQIKASPSVDYLSYLGWDKKKGG